jgi:hypothetical protein
MTTGKVKRYFCLALSLLLGFSAPARAQSSDQFPTAPLVSATHGIALPDAPSATLDFDARGSNTEPLVKLSKAGLARPELASDWRPLSSDQKFHLFIENSYASSTFIAAAISAQTFRLARLTHQCGGECSRGYVAAYADGRSNAFIETFLIPALMRQDPRYFRDGDGTIRHRVGYAMSRVLITRNDHGENVFNSSGIAGAFLSSAVRSAYHPYLNRGLDEAVTGALSRVASHAGMNVLREFWPDLRRKSKGRLATLTALYQP